MPKLRVEELAVKVPCATAVPENGIVSVALEALLVTERLPLAAPLVCGRNTALNVALWPAVKVSGNVRPLTVKPVPLAVACVMVTLEPPELVNVPESVWLPPTCTEPKLRLDGLAVNAPGAMPDPESGKLKLEFEALDVIATLPVTLPDDCGAKVTKKLTACPAESVVGTLSPLRLNPDPVTDAWVRFTLVPPVLVKVTDCF